MRVATLLLALACCTAWPAPAVAAPAGSAVQLEDLTWTELRERIGKGTTTALIPVGGTEQSGPALTLGKHNVRVRELARRIAEQLGGTVVAPVVAYVPEGNIAPPSSHMRFPGTLSVPDAAFQAVLAGAADSLRVHGFTTIVLLGDHGGYQASLRQVADRLNRGWKGRGARVLVPPEYYRASSEGFATLLRQHGIRADEIGSHAGLADTSLQLAIAPDTVRQERLHDALAPGAALGVYGGDPRRASADLGRLGADAIVADTVAALRRELHGRGDPP